MCTHEESTQPTSRPKPRNAWRLIDEPDGAMHHLYNVDALLQGLRMSMEHLNEESVSPDLCHLVHLCGMADEELTAAFSKLEEVLSALNFSPLK